MSHPDEGVLQELLDGELAPADAAAVRAHLEGCAPCTAALAELEAMQVEADAIVSRLPLDPPLARPVRRVQPRRTNLRLLGLAASTLLVAGTSWILLRSPGATPPLMRRDETTSGIVLPMPGQERQEVPAATPAAPPAPVAAEQERKKVSEAKAKEAEIAPAAKDEQGAGQDRVPEEARPMANAAAPAARLAAPAAEASRLGAVAQPGSKTAPDQPGWKVLTIEGLTPVSTEVVGRAADSAQAVVQHYVVNGMPVLLTQRRAPAASDVSIRGAREADVTDQMAKAASNSRVWTSGGILLELEAALPGDSLTALQQRVK